MIDAVSAMEVDEMARHESQSLSSNLEPNESASNSMTDGALSRRKLLAHSGKLTLLATLLGSLSAHLPATRVAAQETDGTPEAGGTTGPAATADASGDPQPGGTLTILTPTDASSLHPGAKTNFY